MATFRVLIDTDNAAFENGASELARILREVAKRVQNGSDDLRDGLILHDVNGNTVGRAQLIGSHIGGIRADGGR